MHGTKVFEDGRTREVVRIKSDNVNHPNGWRYGYRDQLDEENVNFDPENENQESNTGELSIEEMRQRLAIHDSAASALTAAKAGKASSAPSPVKTPGEPKATKEAAVAHPDPAPETPLESGAFGTANSAWGDPK